MDFLPLSSRLCVEWPQQSPGPPSAAVALVPSVRVGELVAVVGGVPLWTLVSTSANEASGGQRT